MCGKYCKCLKNKQWLSLIAVETLSEEKLHRDLRYLNDIAHRKDINNRMSETGKLLRVSKDLIIRHERVLLKQLVLTSSEEELIQGPLIEVPRKRLHVPDYTGSDKLKDDSGLAFKMLRTDLIGERKISPIGELQNGRAYVMNTFTRAGLPHVFVLVSDLMDALLYEGDENSFLQEFPQLLPLELNSEERSFLMEGGFLKAGDMISKYVTARSAFVLFGAAVIATGLRVTDDYWETLAKEQGFTPHHRVFKLSKRLYSILVSLKPSIFLLCGNRENSNDNTSNYQDNQTHFFESPYSTVSEQVSFEVRQEYGREFSSGEHIGVVVPGQSINGALEISSQFKIPKYHSKNSFQQAMQLNALDIPIASPPQIMPSQEHDANPSSTTTPNGSTFPISSHNASGKSGKRLLSNILDSGTSNVFKSKKSEENELIKLTSDLSPVNEQLNINGWKFESFPIKTSQSSYSNGFSPRGLPFYEKEKLIKRLKLLTPNQVREIEHLHDSVFLNTGLQNVRKLRSKKWVKYWQYKTGVPVGLRNIDVKMFKDQYLKEVLEQTTSVTTYNETTNVDEISITKRIPNANFLGHSNIHGFKPPYVNASGDSER